MIMKNLIIVLIAVFALSACSTSPVTDKIQSNITAYINANNSKIMDFMNDTTYLSLISSLMELIKNLVLILLLNLILLYTLINSMNQSRI